MTPSYQQINQAQPGGVINVAQHGDLHVHQGEPAYTLEPWTAAPAAVPGRARRQPSWLLAAASRVVTFVGREQELDALAAWRDAPDHGLSVHLLHGPGGQGKTRLAAEFAAACAAQGWTVAQAAIHPSRTRGPSPPPAPDGQGRLLIVDYAERWPVTELHALFEDGWLQSGGPARVLLLARPAGHWWHSLEYHLVSAGTQDTSATALQPLAEDAAAAAAIFVTARDCFARILEVPHAASIGPPHYLGGKGFRQALAVQMAALAEVDALRTGTDAPRDPTGLAIYLLGRERAYWRALRDGGQLTTVEDVMAHAVYTATLVRPVPYETGRDALIRLGVAASVESADQVLRDHAWCYPSGHPASVLEPLYPDRLGEDFVALSTPGHNAGYPSDPWAAGAVDRLICAEGEEEPGYAGGVVTVLIEASRRWPHVATGLLVPLLLARPRLALAAGDAALARLAELDVDIAVLEAVGACFPEEDVNLAAGMAAVTQRLVAHHLARTDDAYERADLHFIQGVRFAAAGLFADARQAYGETVELLRGLVAADPDAYEPLLAEALSHLGAATDPLGPGHADGALSAAQQSVGILRRLARVDPATYEKGLAGALHRLAMVLGNMGRSAEALAHAEESLAIRRRHVNPENEEQLFHLAMPLNNVSSGLAGLGRHEEALELSRQSVALHRRMLAAGRVPQSDLALALANHCMNLSELGRTDEALASGQEVVGLFRALATALPRRFDHGLAESLSDLATVLAAMDRVKEAIDCLREAAEAARRQVAADALTHGPLLCRLLCRQSKLWRQSGRPRESLDTAAEAAEVARALLAEDPRPSGLDVAHSFLVAAFARAELGHHDQAVADAREGVAAYRKLAALNKGAYADALAHALADLAVILHKAGRPEEAVVACEEAVATFRRPAVTEPATNRARFAGGLRALSRYLHAAGRHAEAIQVAVECADLHGELAADDPARWLAAHVDATASLADLLVESRRWEEAANRFGQAVASLRPLAETDPTAHASNLAGLLQDAGIRALDAGRADDAVPLLRESVEIYRELGRHEWLGQALVDLAMALLDAGEPADALTVGLEATALLQGLAAADPDAHRAELAHGLSVLVDVHTEMDAPEQALAALAESVALSRVLVRDDPEAYGQRLVGRLGRYRDRLSEAERHEEALPVARELVELTRQVTPLSPERLADSLLALSEELTFTERLEEGVDAARQAVDLLRGTLDEDGDDLVWALHSLAWSLNRAGRHEEAVGVGTEAVRRLRVLVARDPDGYGPKLGSVLGDIGTGLAAAGEPEAAARARAEAATLGAAEEEHDAAAPVRRDPDDPIEAARAEVRHARLRGSPYLLGQALTRLRKSLLDHGHAEEAVLRLEEAVALLAGLTVTDPHTYEPEYAARLSDLADDLIALRRFDEAEAGLLDAVALYRSLTREAEAFRPGLRSVLAELGAVRSMRGRHGEAVGCFEESLALSRSGTDPWTVAEESLRYGRCLALLKRHAEAVPVLTEAAERFATLTSDRGDAARSQEAWALALLADSQAVAGHPADALNSTVEAVAAYRLVATGDRAGLATALHNLSNRLASAGRVHEALAAAQECVALRRESAESGARLIPALAMLANRLNLTGQPAEAESALREAVALAREGMRSDAAGYAPMLALALSESALMLARDGRQEESLPTARSGIALCRDLLGDPPKGDSELYLVPSLAACLEAEALSLRMFGDLTGARVAAEEAVGWWRSTTRTAALAAALGGLGDVLADLGSWSEAVSVREEAVQVLRDRGGYPIHVAWAWRSLAEALFQAGRPEETVAPLQTAVGVFREFRSADATALAESLEMLSGYHEILERPEDALAVCEEAVQVRRELLASAAPATSVALAQALYKIAGVLAKLGRFDDALAAMEEAIELFRRLSELSPAEYLGEVAWGMRHLGWCLIDLGRYEEGAARCGEAVGILRRFSLSDPETAEPLLVRTLFDQARALNLLGRPLEGVSRTEEAMVIHERLPHDAIAIHLVPDRLALVSELSAQLASLGWFGHALPYVEEAVAILRDHVDRGEEDYRPALDDMLGELERCRRALAGR
ncbi:tetratricopeptide repeat protein [Nonomuraea sp. NPDC049695]|uniref:tetratricopeptide repeat protein n=1 Tax=Nonomuraea sp. NPDC049695 TaxID=3154734 RepID=UPI00343398C9